jgi:periplasmic mercuric ion binding protein
MRKLIAAMSFAALALPTAFAASPEHAVLDVKGMDCATCPITVKAVLRRLPGVEEVKVDLEKRVAEVTFDGSKVTRERMAQAVTEAGFPTTPRK